ncbi:transcriptional regulator [Tistlia consotensis]|uniref:Transcriptional regulator n=1 Tax=Tistlia consotensis USBA 355 TaxID=560819 RepID=A0A1Y6CGL8_9PROT|nr:LysR substrate-binding domain-containing protein [Tistlia consotensis]SMF54058.1 transcriptional regulator [Tistlia consotensis USBA 355]SNR86494.1 transcriptional regulator [Tistlia consotensis]
MQSLRRLIGSTNALLAFEAAARHGSFTRAAEELNVSQPAVSAAVRQLEAALGTALFRRGHRSVALTEVGLRFQADVTLGLAHIRASAERIALEHRAPHVTLSVSTAFANYWLLPRLSDFRRRHPEVDLRVQTSDRELELGGGGSVLAVRRGRGGWPGYDDFRLAGECIFPIAGPRFLARAGRPASAAELAGCALIHLDEPFRLRPGWADWFAAQGQPYSDRGEGLRLNDYGLVVQAAIAGEGVALGWRHLVGPLVEQGLVERLLEAALADGTGFYVVWPRAMPLAPQAELVRDWLRAQAEWS